MARAAATAPWAAGACGPPWVTGGITSTTAPAGGGKSTPTRGTACPSASAGNGAAGASRPRPRTAPGRGPAGNGDQHPARQPGLPARPPPTALHVPRVVATSIVRNTPRARPRSLVHRGRCFPPSQEFARGGAGAGAAGGDVGPGAGLAGRVCPRGGLFPFPFASRRAQPVLGRSAAGGHPRLAALVSGSNFRTVFYVNIENL